MKIHHTGDWHLRDRDIEECEKCLTFLVETAQKEAVDLVVIAGDIFHSQDIKLDSQSTRLAVKTVSALADIAPVAIVLGTATHDGKAPEILGFARGGYQIHVATIPEQVILSKGAIIPFLKGLNLIQPDAVLTLIPQPGKQYFQTASGISEADQEIGQAMSGLFAGFGAQAAEYKCPHILIGHFNVNGCRLANKQILTGMEIEVSVDQMNLANPTIGLLDHIHIAQVLGDKYYYSGPIYATKIDEDGPKGFWIHEIDKECVLIPEEAIWFKSRFVETPCKRTVRIKVDYTAHPMDAPAYSLPLDEDVEGKELRIEFTAWQDEALLIQKEVMKEAYLAAGALSVDIHITPVPRANIRAEAVLNALTLRDEVFEMARLRGEEIDGDILAFAELLESVPGEELLAKAAGGEA